MKSLINLVTEKGFRIMVCETQNTNVPAIRFYCKLGFEIYGVDLDYYTDKELKLREVAIFMKLRLGK